MPLPVNYSNQFKCDTNDRVALIVIVKLIAWCICMYRRKKDGNTKCISFSLFRTFQRWQHTFHIFSSLFFVTTSVKTHKV